MNTRFRFIRGGKLSIIDRPLSPRDLISAYLMTFIRNQVAYHFPGTMEATASIDLKMSWMYFKFFQADSAHCLYLRVNDEGGLEVCFSPRCAIEVSMTEAGQSVHDCTEEIAVIDVASAIALVEAIYQGLVQGEGLKFLQSLVRVEKSQALCN